MKLQDNVTLEPGVVLTIGGILVCLATGPQAKSDSSRLLHGRCRNFLGSEDDFYDSPFALLEPIPEHIGDIE